MRELLGGWGGEVGFRASNKIIIEKIYSSFLFFHLLFCLILISSFG